MINKILKKNSDYDQIKGLIEVTGVDAVQKPLTHPPSMVHTGSDPMPVKSAIMYLSLHTVYTHCALKMNYN